MSPVCRADARYKRNNTVQSSLTPAPPFKTIMQFFVKALVALSVAAASVQAAEKPENGVTVPLTRRNSFLTLGEELNLKAVVAHMDNIQQKYKRSMDNFKRRTGQVNPLVRALAELFKRDDTTSIGLDVVDDGQLWTGPVSFGGQKFDLDFDTGSADVIVNPGAYHPSGSAKNTHTGFSTAYADGTSAKGDVYLDNFQVGSISTKDVAIGRSKIQFIKGEGKSQGIAGLSFNSISTFQSDKYKPFFDTLVDNKAVKNAQFQFSLQKNSGSELFFGGIDQSKISGDIAWADVDSSKGFWATDMSINGQKITGILDSGSTIITGPTEQVRRLFSKLGGVQSFTQGSQLFGAYDCNKAPDVTLEFGGQKFKLEKDVVSFGKSKGKCILSVNGMDNIPMNAWIIGDTFFIGHSVIFDADKKRAGIAKRS